MKEDCSMQTDQRRRMSFCQRSSACSKVRWVDHGTSTNYRPDKSSSATRIRVFTFTTTNTTTTTTVLLLHSFNQCTMAEKFTIIILTTTAVSYENCDWPNYSKSRWDSKIGKLPADSSQHLMQRMTWRTCNSIQSILLSNSEWVEFYILLFAQHIIGHQGHESFQAITCTGTDNSKQMRKYTKNTKTN